MKIVCTFCGRPFSILPEQLGTQRPCPHCKAVVQLPHASGTAAPRSTDERELRRPFAWLDGSISGLISLVLHMVIMIVIAYTQQTDEPGGVDSGLGEEVMIGVLPTSDLTNRQETEISLADASQETPSQVGESLEVTQPVPTAGGAAASGLPEVGAGAPIASASGTGGFEVGSVGIAGGAQSGSGSWGNMLQTLRKNGLDVVICFDSTGSMGGEIDEVKTQIRQIGNVLFTLVPKARIGLCTYRDSTDNYVVKGVPLTSNIQELEAFLARVDAGGGGDLPEAVDEGMYWSITKNQFRPQSRKVLLIFGDAPPHADKQKACVSMALDFKRQMKGIVSTVTCRSEDPLPEFYEISAAGGGEAYLTKNQREIVRELMVLVFGSRHRDKVLEAFRLLGK